ncbi:MAG: tetratricopeptide repeat protein [Acidobacteriota bacterium]
MTASPLQSRLWQCRWRQGVVSLSPQRTAVLLISLTLAVYLNTLGNDFAYDDIPIIVNNPSVHQLDWSGLWLRGYWSHVVGGGGNYRPLTSTTFAVEYQLWGEHPTGYHLVNILLHTANVIWLFFLLRCYRVSVSLAGLAAALFAVHPVHTEAVANVVGRAELLGMFFGGLMWWAWLYGRPGGARGWTWRAAAAVAYLAAVLSKENMIVLPAALFAGEWLAGRFHRRRSGGLKDAWPFGVFLLVLVLYVWLRTLAGEGIGQQVETGHVPLAGRSLWERCLIMAGVSVTWYRLVLIGYPLQAMYSIREFDLTPTLHWRLGLGLGITVGLLILAVVCRRHAPIVTFAVVFWFITLSVTSNVLLPLGALLAERWLYLPSVAAVLLISVAAWRGFQSGGAWRPVALVGMTSCLVFYSLITVWRNRDWQNNVTIFESLVATAPDNSSGYTMLGHEIMTVDPLRARKLQEAALARDPVLLSPQASLAELDLREGNVAAACDRLAMLLAQEPPNLPTPSGEWASWHALYAKALALSGDLPLALEHAQIALRQAPTSLQVLFETSQVFLRAGKIEEALAGFRQLIAYDRDQIRAYSNLATVLIELERYTEAEAVLLEGLQQAPGAEALQARLDFVRQQRTQERKSSAAAPAVSPSDTSP